MAVTGALGAKLYLNDTAMLAAVVASSSISDFQGYTITTELGFIENFGELGRVFQSVTFQETGSGRTIKLKGGYNEGQMQLTLGQDLSDAGQAFLKTHADASNQNTYPFKIILVGAPAAFTYVYFGAQCLSFKTNPGGANSVIKAMTTLEINTPIYYGSS